MLNVGFEGLRVGGSFYGHGGAHGSFEGDGSDQRSVLAAVSGNLALEALFPLGALALSGASHRGVEATLVHEYKAPRASKWEASQRHKPLASSSRS